MNRFTTNTFGKILSLPIVFSILFMACRKIENNKVSNDLRVLKVKVNGEDFAQGAVDIENKDLTIELIFSHSLNTTALENALTVSGAPDYSIAYDDTKSFATLTFTNLSFDKKYTLSIPSGDYGVQGEGMAGNYSLTFTTKAFLPPGVSISAGKTDFFEGESDTVKAMLNKVSVEEVLVTLNFEGSAEGNGVDYSTNVEAITIPVGETSGFIIINAINDGMIEGAETLTITIQDLQNATETSPQKIDITFNDEVPSLELKGIMAIRWATEPGGSSGKAVHLKVLKDIPDLSIYSLGVANNGGGTDGIEYTLPNLAVSAGEDILVARDPAALESYFGAAGYAEFEQVIQTDEMSQNGDDAIELYKRDAVIEVYGDANVDGTGQPWEYKGSWAYKFGDRWENAPVSCSEGSTSALTSDCIYPLIDQPLVLKGVMAILWDGSGTNGGKAIHLLANKDIADLSQYSIGVANNGGGTDGIEYTLPQMSVSEGDEILLAREPDKLSAYFGSCYNTFDKVFQTDAMNQNGDDAIELYKGATIIETFGDINVDGTGQTWEYSGSWAYKLGSKWKYGGVDCAAGSTTTQGATCVYPLCQ